MFAFPEGEGGAAVEGVADGGIRVSLPEGVVHEDSESLLLRGLGVDAERGFAVVQWLRFWEGSDGV